MDGDTGLVSPLADARIDLCESTVALREPMPDDIDIGKKFGSSCMRIHDGEGSPKKRFVKPMPANCFLAMHPRTVE